MAARRIRRSTDGYGNVRTGTDLAEGNTGSTGNTATGAAGLRFALFDNPEKSEKVISALRKIADGSEQETIPGLRNDLAQYGGTNDITFYWGNEKKGIYHIAYRRGVDTLLHVIDAVADGNINRFVKGNKTVILEKDGFEAVLALTEYGNQKSWLLSGWKTNEPDASGEVGTPSAATQLKPTFSRQELGAGIDSILPNSENVKSESEKNRKKDNFRFSVSGDGTDFNGVDRKWVVSAMGNDLTSTADTLLASNPSEAAKQGVAPKGLCTIGDVFDNVKPDGEKNRKNDNFRFLLAEFSEAERREKAHLEYNRKRDQYLYDNFPFYREAVEFAGSHDFKIKPSGKFRGEEFSGYSSLAIFTFFSILKLIQAMKSAATPIM